MRAAFRERQTYLVGGRTKVAARGRGMMTMLRWVVAAAGSLFAVPIADAQTASATRSLCWTAKPLPECRSWVVTEFALEYGAATTRLEASEGKDFEQRWGLTFGRMWNVSAGNARGFTGA